MVSSIQSLFPQVAQAYLFLFSFLDEIILFRQASNNQVRLVSDTLEDFCKASCLKVNLEKSLAM